jgi:hypothetical protein
LFFKYFFLYQNKIGGSGLIGGVAFGGSGLIRGVAFGGSGLIRGVSFGGRGLIRGELLNNQMENLTTTN